MTVKKSRKRPVKKNADASKLLKTIIDAIQDKKGNDIVSLDLTAINERVCDYFIICHGDSTTQVKAIADNIIDRVSSKQKENPWHKEGFENLDWVLLDYVNVVVHVFHFRKRSFYQLEDLWSDGITTRYD